MKEEFESLIKKVEVFPEGSCCIEFNRSIENLEDTKEIQRCLDKIYK